MWPYSSILKSSWFSGDLKYCWLRWPHSSILMCYWFSCDLIPAHWNIVDSDGTSFHHTHVLLILMRPHSSILMCYWFWWYCIPAYWRVKTILVWPYSSILKYCWFSGDLKYCWLSADLMLAYWCVIDSHVTSFQHTEVLLIPMVPHSSILSDVLLILMWPHSSILRYCWFSGDLILAD
jgi:hypothetical protein